MRLIFIFFILSYMALVSCDSLKSENIEYNSEPFPEKYINVDFQTYLIDSGISGKSKVYHGMKIDFFEEERQIVRLREMLENTNQTKSRDTLEVMEKLWQSTFINRVPNDSSLIADWINITSGLMAITGKPVYADELERVMLVRLSQEKIFK